MRKAVGVWMALGFLAASPAVAGVESAGTGSLAGGQSGALVKGYGAANINDDALAVLSEEHAVATARAMAACVVRNDARRAANVVLASSDEVAAKLSAVRHQMELCLSGQVSETTRMRFGTPELQGFFAEALLQRTPPAITEINGPIEVFPLSTTRPSSMREILNRTSSCTALAHPLQTLAVVRSIPGSQDETAAITALMPTFKSCIDPHQTFRAGRNGVRLSLAAALFKRATTGFATVSIESAGKN